MKHVFTEEERKTRKRARDKKYRDNLSEERKVEVLEYMRKYRSSNRDKVNARSRDWYNNMSPESREKALKIRTEYNRKNKEKLANWAKSNQHRYYKENRDVICKKLAERRKKDSLFKLAATYRVRTRKFLKKYSNSKKSREILGCDWEKLRGYLESMFKDGMTWENHGKWHIDHIKPLSRAKDEADLLSRCHYTNLQPLWAIDNMRKSNKVK